MFVMIFQLGPRQNFLFHFLMSKAHHCLICYNVCTNFKTLLFKNVCLERKKKTKPINFLTFSHNITKIHHKKIVVEK
jgi:hypothetical protein